MTAPGEDILAWLDAAITRFEEAARAATERQPYDEWDAVGDDREGDTARKYWSVVGIAQMKPTPAARDLAEHIAMNDPASVLRRCAADRKLLELHAGRMHSCPAKDETGYLDEWTSFGHEDICPVVRLLAEGYGWTGGER